MIVVATVCAFCVFALCALVLTIGAPPQVVTPVGTTGDASIETVEEASPTVNATVATRGYGDDASTEGRRRVETAPRRRKGGGGGGETVAVGRSSKVSGGGGRGKGMDASKTKKAAGMASGLTSSSSSKATDADVSKRGGTRGESKKVSSLGTDFDAKDAVGDRPRPKGRDASRKRGVKESDTSAAKKTRDVQDDDGDAAAGGHQRARGRSAKGGRRGGPVDAEGGARGRGQTRALDGGNLELASLGRSKKVGDCLPALGDAIQGRFQFHDSSCQKGGGDKKGCVDKGRSPCRFCQTYGRNDARVDGEGRSRDFWFCPRDVCAVHDLHWNLCESQ